MNRRKLDKIKALVAKLFVKLYAKSDKFDALNAVRAHVYYKGRKYLEALAPTNDALQHHVLLCYISSMYLGVSIESFPEILDPFKF